MIAGQRAERAAASDFGITKAKNGKMKLLLPRLKAAFPHVGERSVTTREMFDLCSSRAVHVITTSAVERGLYVRQFGEDFIFLNSRLTGWRMLHVFAHEIAHCLLHVPARTQNAAFHFDGVTARRHHREAESAAALLLIPPREIERMLIDGEFRENESLADLISLRLDLIAKGL